MATALGRGVYTFADAARFTKLKQTRIREWFRQRPAGSRLRPIFQSDYQPVDGDWAISFHDLVDVYVAGHLRTGMPEWKQSKQKKTPGISLQTLRRVYAKLQSDFATDHPFCRKELLTDGATVFVRGLDGKGEEEIKEVLTRQKVFPKILLPFLKTLEYDGKLAAKWHIADEVVLDPEICFGAPVVERVSIPTSILAASYRANLENAERVASWHGVTPKDVLAAVAFESHLAA